MSATSETTPLSRLAAMDAIDKLRGTPPPGDIADDMLALITRDLWDGEPLEAAYSSLKGATPYLSADTVQTVRDLLDRIAED